MERQEFLHQEGTPEIRHIYEMNFGLPELPLEFFPSHINGQMDSLFFFLFNRIHRILNCSPLTGDYKRSAYNQIFRLINQEWPRERVIGNSCFYSNLWQILWLSRFILATLFHLQHHQILDTPLNLDQLINFEG